MRVSDDHSLFAWSCSDNHSSLLARSPDAFRDSGDIVPHQPDDEARAGPYISNSGIHLELDLSPDEAKSPLYYTSEYGYDSIVRLLVEKGANVTSQYEEQRSPLLYAILGNHVRIALELIACGASPHSSDNKGKSPLSHVSEREQYDLAELLVDNGAEIDNKDHFHKTSLAYAARELEVETIRVLLKHGAGIEAVGGESAMSLALDETHPDIVRAFNNHSAMRPKAEDCIIRKRLQGDKVDGRKSTEKTRDAVHGVTSHRKQLKPEPKPERAHHRSKLRHGKVP
ncbi:unnamed protein product [Clonostachys rosea]|uniref:Uncharacterized protein n=1 Tax=Bionectria ochroleuca TaxID=29856 RepID=A0ABY6UBB5_BIOOC|nr:unnamed protein product [Clonostachys rosea]